MKKERSFKLKRKRIMKADKMTMPNNQKAAAKSTYPKVAVQWLNQALCFYQSLCLVDPAHAGLRNRHLRVAAKRYQQF
jgi:hypothetical protein